MKNRLSDRARAQAIYEMHASVLIFVLSSKETLLQLTLPQKNVHVCFLILHFEPYKQFS